MKPWFPLLLAALLPLPALAQEAWKAVETERFYAVDGRSGIELYRSIGERGPKAGSGRAIASTDFDLRWRRDYQPRGGACVLASARPSLTVTYTLPKPSGSLASPVAANWKNFIAGLRRHEKVHGDIIVSMVREIEAVSVGLTIADDPGCRKIRAVLTERLAALSRKQRERSRAFDRAEMSEGGAVHRLILALVNGG